MYSKEERDAKAKFMEHLERSSETVSKWPCWKQSVLGGGKQYQNHCISEGNLKSKNKDEE